MISYNSGMVQKIDPTYKFRQGTPEDSYTVLEILYHSLMDLNRRSGLLPENEQVALDEVERAWEGSRSFFEHLAQTAESFWVVEKESRPIGYARSILRSGMRELTELFILPGRQSAGLGRELMRLVFPPPSEGVEHRCIIATTDLRGLVLYLRSGVYPRFPIYFFGRKPDLRIVDSDLEMLPISNSEENLNIIGGIDEIVLGHRRDEDHRWFLSSRQGYLYVQGESPVGYGYVGQDSGPFALLEADDIPAVLAHAENQAAEIGVEYFGFQVPMINKQAVDILLEWKYRMEPLFYFFMSDQPFGKFENYIFTNPIYFL